MKRLDCIAGSLVALVLAAALGGCDSPEGGGSTAPASGTGTGTGSETGTGTGAGEVVFVDVARELGIDLFSAGGNVEKEHLLESTGSGVAVADYDADGDVDVYIGTQQTTTDWLAGRRPRANGLFRNDGNGSFTEVAAEAGVDLRAWTAGTYFVDYDDDGDKDLFVTTWGPNVIFRNDGDGTFTDVTEGAGVAGAEDAWSASAAFGDLDRDGDLDLYVTNYCVYDPANPPFGTDKSIWQGIAVYPGPLGFTGQRDVLYRNEGDGTFADVTQEVGIDAGTPRYGLGVLMSDLDDDGDLDIYVANDAVSNYLWRNDGGFRFTESAVFSNVATNEDAREQSSMGLDAADYDGDGDIDLFVTNFSHDFNTLYRNEGNLLFSDATFRAGLNDAYTDLAWGTRFFDYDHDGRLDLIVANGHIFTEVDDHPRLNTSYEQLNRLYWNRGDGTFEDRTDRAGPGLSLIAGTRGLAISDLDLDGDLDVVMSNIDGLPTVLRNDGGNRRSWASVTLTGGPSPREAIGARLVLEAAGRRFVREVNPHASYQSQGDYAVHFGLDDIERVDRLTVRWPSGAVEVLEDLPVRKFLFITEGRGLTARREAGP